MSPRPLGKVLERTMGQLARLKARGARPRRIARLAARAQRLLDDYQRRELAGSGFGGDTITFTSLDGT